MSLLASLQCLVEHGEQLEVRRRQTGTHVAHYAVAPYYVYFSH